MARTPFDGHCNSKTNCKLAAVKKKRGSKIIKNDSREYNWLKEEAAVMLAPVSQQLKQLPGR